MTLDLMQTKLRGKISEQCIAIKEDQHPRQKTVIVTACGRGGTSVIAGAVHALGIAMVNDDPETTVNFEDSAFIDAWNDLKTDPGSGSPYTETCKRIRSIIMTRNQNKGSWGWKDPYAYHYLRGVIDACRNPQLIHVIRNPFNTAQSTIKAANSIGESLSVEEAYSNSLTTLELIWESIQHCGIPTLLISFEQALSNKFDLISDLINFLDLHPDEESIANCINFISPGGGYRSLSKPLKH